MIQRHPNAWITLRVKTILLGLCEKCETRGSDVVVSQLGNVTLRSLPDVALNGLKEFVANEKHQSSLLEKWRFLSFLWKERDCALAKDI